MTQAHKTVGAIVEVHAKCFQPPYTPYYDYLKGVKLEVMGAGPPGHVYVRIVGSTETFMLHDDELKTVPKRKR
jgi:hypothetical protein